ncbi:MAG: hypothetical protein PHP08_01695 [Candidatus Dojkabacteria bacterium]|nr:hypothetical protein [Candidatus Dojkabacteria bacterium]
MKKDTVWLVIAIVLLLAVVGGLVWIFGGFDSSGTEVSDTASNSEEIIDDENTEDDTNTEESNDQNTTDEEDDLDSVEIDSSVTYSTDSQSVGEETDELFTLTDIEVSKGEDVMEIVYTLSGDSLTEDSTLKVVAVNKSSLGAMEIALSGVKSDSTGMSYDQSIDINREGITKLTKVVSGVENTLKYTLGFTDALEYYLYEPELSGSSLIVKLSIKYPGGEISTDEYGTTEFTSEDISVESSTVDEGVRISGYTYSSSSGVLKFIMKTSSNTGSPIPSFESSLEDAILTVVFPSLNADVIYSATEGSVSLPGGVTLDITRSGNQSTYEFIGVGSEYKIYGTTSPNQITVEVKL